MKAVREALAGMTEQDTFNLVKFSSGAASLFAAPQPATAENVREAAAWLATFQGGGTRMEQGLMHALSQPGDPDALRLVLLTTDGYIGDERGLFEVVEEHRGKNTRVFGLGVGSSVNRLLLEGLANVGRGAVQVQLPSTPIEETVRRFHQRIARPAMTDLAIDWGELNVEDQYPRELPDLWAGQPIRVVARVSKLVNSTVRLTGRVGDQRVGVSRPLSAATTAEHEGVRTLWARRRIAWLERPGLTADDVEARRDEIRDTGLRHHLVSRETSLIAVDDNPSPCGAATQELDVPLVVPSGTVAGRGGGLKGSGAFGVRGSGAGGGGIANGVTVGIGSSGGVFGSSSATPKPVIRTEAPVGTVSVGDDTIVLGERPRSMIEGVLKRRMGALRHCYQRELNKNHTLGGNVVVKFMIAADGTVRKAELLESTLNHEAMEACVVERFLHTKFTAGCAGGMVMVRYSLVFRAEP